MDSGNNSSSCKEFNSQTLFITNANNNGFSISKASTTTAAVPTSNSSSSSNNRNSSFLDTISFLPTTSPFPILLGPLGPDIHVPAQPAPANTSSSPRSTSTTSSKKRSRPSRRAPTTVLTTDTSNFRAMVQEFTGIPSPPPPSSSTSASPYRFATPSPSFLQLKPYPHNPSYHHPPPPPPPPSLNFGLSNPQLLLLQSQLAMKAQTTPSTSAAAAGYESAADLGQQLTGVIGSGWGQDAGGVDPTGLLTQVISNGACCKLNNYSD